MNVPKIHVMRKVNSVQIMTGATLVSVPVVFVELEMSVSMLMSVLDFLVKHAKSGIAFVLLIVIRFSTA